jgi:hypothetical protein
MALEPTKRVWLGSRTAFSQGFLKDLAEVWRDHGLHAADDLPHVRSGRRSGRRRRNRVDYWLP